MSTYIGVTNFKKIRIFAPTWTTGIHAELASMELSDNNVINYTN